MEPIDEYVFKGNNGTIAQQGESVGKVELKVRDESSRGAYGEKFHPVCCKTNHLKALNLCRLHSGMNAYGPHIT